MLDPFAPTVDDSNAFLSGGGEAGALMRALDWSASPLGSPSGWPQSLRTVVALLLGSKFPMFVAWGAELGFIYNDAYAVILGAKHPRAMGARFEDIWAEIWEDVGPLARRALEGEATWLEDLPLIMNRKGFDEQTWFTFSYSPVRDESEQVAGMFCAVAETSEKVLAERRLAEEAMRQRRQFERAPGFITILQGPEHRFEFVNETYVRLFGDRPYVGKTVRDAFPELEGQGFFEKLDSVYATGERFVAKGLPARLDLGEGKEQTESFLDFIYAPITDEAGNVTGIFCEGYDVTEAHRARESLALSEERLRLATEAAEVGFWDVDLVNDVLIWPPIVKAMFGISPDVPVSMMDFYSGLHPTDRSHTAAAFAAACDPEQRAVYDVEYRTVGKEDGLVRWVAAKGRGLFDASGRCVRVTGTAVDVTGRKAAEEAALAQAEELSGVFDAVPSAIWIARDPECREIMGNKVAHELLRMSADANMSKSGPEGQVTGHFRVFGADGAELPTEQLPIQRAARGEAVRDFEQRVAFDDGTSIDLLGNAIPLKRPGGETWGAVGAFTDITSRKAAEGALRESEARFRLMADAVPALVWVIDGQGRIEFLNRQWFEYTGAASTAASNLEVAANHIHPDDGERMIATFDEARRSGGTFLMELRIRSQNDDYRWFLARGEPHRNPETGVIERWFGASVDIHDRKAAEGALQELNETLERRVGERTAELEQAQEALRQSQKLEAMGQLTGGVAHDFNNLLTPIIGSLDMLQRRGVGDERAQRQIGGALQSAERAKTLVQRLLAFARRQPLQATAVDLDALVTGMADLIASTSGPQIKLIVDMAAALPPARADANQVEMALLNLAVNARDAMPDGGRLTISASAEMADLGHSAGLPAGSYVRLSVSDTGVGMDEATLARAIEPFFSTKGVGQGTGLGLSMVHGLAAQLGGALTIRSRKGLGTSVELWLPVASAEAATRIPEQEIHPTSGAGTVLLVDDEELVRASTADMLGDLGYEVMEASSAEAALRKIDEGAAIDLLITDHLMPGMNGTELARMVQERRAKVPVLIVSGYAEDAGIDPDLPRLTKPFRQSDLAELLTQLAGRSPGSAQSRTPGH